MSSDWRSARLGDLLSIAHGWPFKSEFFCEEVQGRAVVVGVGNFRYTGGFRFESTKTKEYTAEYPSSYNLEPGDILLVMTCQTAGGEILGIPGRIPADGRQYLHNQRLGKVVVTSPEEVDHNYLYWLFLSGPFNYHLVSTASGTKILHTAPKRIESFECLLPPLDEQRRIAAVLGALDDKIELNRKMNRTLEAMAQAIFKSWFIDFDGHDPDDMVESELGPIPKGWKAGVLEDCLVLQRGFDLPATQRTSGPFPVISAGGESGTHSVARVRGPGVVTGRSGKLGDVYLVNQDFWPLNTTLWIKQYRRSSPYHAFQLLRTLALDRFNAGSAVPTLNRNHVHGLPLPIPPADHVVHYDAAARPIFDRHRLNEVQSRTLSALRDALLPKLISGEIRVPEAEAAIEEATA